MKNFIIAAASLALLAGCAAPGPNQYGTNTYGQPVDPNGWRVVSVTPVPAGTGARAAAAGETGVTTTYRQPVYSSQPAYSSQPGYASQPGYTTQPTWSQQQPVYVPQPIYVPQPVYEPRYYYPPVSIGLGFNFGRGWGHHRGWGGRVGTRFPYHYRR